MVKLAAYSSKLLNHSIPSCRDQALMMFEDWKSNNRIQSAPSNAEAKEAVETFGAIAESPLSKNRALVAIISDLERME